MRPTLADALESLFRQHPGEWLDGHLLADCAGFAGWRSRVSDVRARGLKITNRVRHVTRNGRRFAITEYVYRPADLLEIAEGAAPEPQCSPETEASC